MIGFLGEKIERDNDKLMNNNHKLKLKTWKILMNFEGKNNWIYFFIISNYIDLINYKTKIDLINFKLKCYQKC